MKLVLNAVEGSLMSGLLRLKLLADKSDMPKDGRKVRITPAQAYEIKMLRKDEILPSHIYGIHLEVVE